MPREHNFKAVVGFMTCQLCGGHVEWIKIDDHMVKCFVDKNGTVIPAEGSERILPDCKGRKGPGKNDSWYCARCDRGYTAEAVELHKKNHITGVPMCTRSGCKAGLIKVRKES